MRKIRIFEHTSIDGVIEHDKNYAYGGWTAPYRTPAGMAMLLEAYGTDFDMLLGRKTYDEFLGYWPNAGDFPMANAINAATKYVATHRPERLEWGPVKDLGEGKRLISDSINARELEFVSTLTTPTGVLLNTYRHLGSLKS